MTFDAVSDTELALRRAVLGNPEEDTPRLMFADYLDETAGPDRKCEACGGSGSMIYTRINDVPTGIVWRLDRELENLGGGFHERWESRCQTCYGFGMNLDPRRAWAEFIRNQIAATYNIDPWRPCGGYYCETDPNGFVRHRGCGYDRLRQREADLRPVVAESMRLVRDDETQWAPMYEAVFTHGFLTAVEMSAESWLVFADALVWGHDKCLACVDQSPNWETNVVECRRCESTGVVDRPCPPTAHPIVKVILTTRPVAGSLRVVRTQRDWILPPSLGIDVMDSWRAEWPGIEFVLPGNA